MNRSLTLEQIENIKKFTEQGQKSPWIASNLGLKVRTVRKYVQRIKKNFSSFTHWSPFIWCLEYLQ